MAEPVRPLESASALDVSRSAGPVALPSSNFPSETETPALPGPRVVKPTPVQRNNPALNETAERVGFAVGNAANKVREIPRRVQEMKQRLTVVRGRSSEDAKTAASEWKETAQERLHVARNRAQLYAHEYPLQVLAGAAGLGFVIGLILRIWRSSHARA